MFEWSTMSFFFLVIYFCMCNISIFVTKVRCQKVFAPACVRTASLTRSYHGFIVVCVIRSRNASSPSKPLNTPYTAWKEQNRRPIISIDWVRGQMDEGASYQGNLVWSVQSNLSQRVQQEFEPLLLAYCIFWLTLFLKKYERIRWHSTRNTLCRDP